MRTHHALPALLALGVVNIGASAQVIEASFDEPTGDRWMYPFNGTPGTRLFASTFSAAEAGPGFDDRDAQFVLLFDTSGQITPGLDASEYRIISARVTAVIDNDEQFRYDPTPDSYVTQLFDTDPSYVPDTDPGRAITIFGTGYRAGWDVFTWTETTTFGSVAEVDPAQGMRTIFAANFDSQGTAHDVSNNVKQRFDPTPLGVGMTDTVAPGDLVPEGTVFTFELDRCESGGLGFLQRSLRDGSLNLSISSMHLATGGKGGGTGDVTYPFFKTKDDIVALLSDEVPTLELVVRVGSPGNYDGQGGVDFSDVLAFLSDFGANDPAADLAPPCGLDFSDVLVFLQAFAEGG